LVCFHDVSEGLTLDDLLKPEDRMCGKCRKQLVELNASYPVLGISVHALYLYTPFFENLIFQFKEANDLPLAPIFLEPYRTMLRRRLKNAVVVAVPSSPKRSAQRGYVPIEVLFRAIGIPVVHPFEKDEVKQSQRSAQRRTQIARHIRLRDVDMIRGKRVIVVDDVCTTGHSVKACVDLLTPHATHVSCVVVAIHPTLIHPSFGSR
jgi:competence protein ComFC